MGLRLRLCDHRFGLFGLRENGAASLIEGLAGVRDTEAPAGPLDQAQAQPLLESRDPSAEFLLRLAQGTSGGGKAAMRDHLGEISIVVEINALLRSSNGTVSAKFADYKLHRSSRIYQGQRRFAEASRRETMKDRFSNKVVVVTGGSSGIGLATAKAFSAEGLRCSSPAGARRRWMQL